PTSRLQGDEAPHRAAAHPRWPQQGEHLFGGRRGARRRRRHGARHERRERGAADLREGSPRHPLGGDRRHRPDRLRTGRLMEYRAKAEIVDISRRLHARGWVANHDGNVTCRVGEGRIWATPTAVSKGIVTEEMLIAVDLEGKRIAGRLRPFGEL